MFGYFFAPKQKKPRKGSSLLRRYCRRTAVWLSPMSFVFALSALANNLRIFSPCFLDMLLYISVAFTVLKNKILFLLFFFFALLFESPVAYYLWWSSSHLSCWCYMKNFWSYLWSRPGSQYFSSMSQSEWLWLWRRSFKPTGQEVLLNVESVREYFPLSLFLPSCVRGSIKNQNPVSSTALPLLNSWIFKLWLWCLRRLCGFEMVITQQKSLQLSSAWNSPSCKIASFTRNIKQRLCG